MALDRPHRIYAIYPLRIARKSDDYITSAEHHRSILGQQAGWDRGLVPSGGYPSSTGESQALSGNIFQILAYREQSCEGSHTDDKVKEGASCDKHFPGDYEKHLLDQGLGSPADKHQGQFDADDEQEYI